MSLKRRKSSFSCILLGFFFLTALSKCAFLKDLSKGSNHSLATKTYYVRCEYAVQTYLENITSNYFPWCIKMDKKMFDTDVKKKK